MSNGELVYLVWNDFVGLSRTRGVPTAQYDRRREHGLGWAVAGQSLTPFEDIAPNPWGPVDEVRQVPDDSTRLRVILRPDMPPLHLVLCNSLIADGSPWECCTRSFLASALREFTAQTGLAVHIAYENEFRLGGEGMVWAPPFSLESVRRVAPFAEICAAALIDAQVGLETFEPEYGVGQYEVSCAPAAGVAGADRVVLTREVIREAARQCRLHASFTPKPAPDAVGNGCHLHLSFWDADGRAAAFDADGPGQLSPVAGQFVAGVRQHLAALLAVTAPSPVSYMRLGPHHWSCGYDAVGVQNREAAVRICPAPGRSPDEQASGFNIEFRATDATASPYLAVGTVVRAGLEGIRARLPAPTLIDGDPADLDAAQRAELGIAELPSSLDTALDIFQANATVRSWFTPTWMDAYTSLKRKEAADAGAMTPERMCARYGDVY